MTQHYTTTEAQSRDVAEQSREKEWKHPSFLKELFLGNFDVSILGEYPDPPSRQEFVNFRDWMLHFLETEVDSAQMDRDGKYPADVLEKLRERGAFGMKIPKLYGGLGFTAYEYANIMKIIGSKDSNIAVLLSAHQSIGVPQPVYHFGSEYLKQEYLPRCAKGEISAFALTETEVGSDPARLATTVRKEGSHYILNGSKIWCTNGTFADLLVVMARHEETNKISAFVVETEWEGVSVAHRCKFMGLNAIENGVLNFVDVKVPTINLIGNEGQGLKIALTTLNAGRLALPAGSAGLGKQLLRWTRDWCNRRVQWGKPIGNHEAVAVRLANMVMDTFEMEAVSDLTSDLASRKNTDIRIEAAAAKEINTVIAWNMLDDAIQTRGGRGYENEVSLKERGEDPIPLERMMRDNRINRIIEGTSDIMHLFIAREAVDQHLKVAGELINPKANVWNKLKAFLRATVHYSIWYPKLWVPKFNSYKGSVYSKQLRYIEKMSRKLARNIFYGMVRYQAGLEKRQLFLFRAVDIGLELYKLTASIMRADDEIRKHTYARKEHIDLLVVASFRRSRSKIDKLFKSLWRNDDKLQCSLSKKIYNYTWVEN